MSMLIEKTDKQVFSAGGHFFQETGSRALRCCIVILGCLFSFFSPFSGTAGENEKMFNEEELKQFCRDMPVILASMNNEEKDTFFRSVILDYPHAVFPEVIMRDSRLSLQSERITYIVFHIILAGIIEDMGGFGEGRLEFMKQEREKVKNNPKIPPNEKKRILTELENSISHLNDLIVQTKSIPRSELVLLWQEKDTLNAMLREKVPLKQKRMARQ
jgi:hypothetical protein